MDLITQLAERRSQISDDLTNMASADSFDPEAQQFRELQVEGENLDKRIAALQAAQEQRMAADELWSKLRRPPAAAAGRASQDVGEVMLRSESYKSWTRNGMSGRAHIAEIELERRAVLTSAWFPGQDQQVVAAPPRANTPLLDAVGNLQVSTSTVEVVTYEATPPLAGVVAEGAAKPEATIATQVVPVTLDTLAHWIKVTRRALADQSMVRDLISGGLLRGVEAKAEADAGTAIAGGTYDAVAGATMMESLRLGMGAVASKGYNPSAALLNPADLASLDFYIWDNTGGTSTGAWGLRLISSNSIAAGTAYVGDFNTGAKYLYQGAAQLYVTDSDISGDAATATSDFRKNIITFLAEITSKTVIVQADAIAECTPSGAAAARAQQPQAKK